MKETDIAIFSELINLLTLESLDVYRSFPNLTNDGFLVYLRSNDDQKIEDLKDYKNLIIKKVTFKPKTKNYILEYTIDPSKVIPEKDTVVNKRIVIEEPKEILEIDLSSLIEDLTSKCLSVQSSSNDGTLCCVVVKDGMGEERVKNLDSFKEFILKNYDYNSSDKTSKIYYEYKKGE